MKEINYVIDLESRVDENNAMSTVMMSSSQRNHRILDMNALLISITQCNNYLYMKIIGVSGIG